MADNVKDLFKQALKLTSDGKLEKAIEAYQAILKKTPKDTRVLNNLGDLYLRKKLYKEAAGIFGDLAKLYEDDGYTLRAIAICQKVLKIDPEMASIKARMAELYAKQGLVAEARIQYLDLASFLEKKGQVKEALEIFRKLADLDPGNLSVRAKLGNMFHKEGMNQKAVLEWIKAAEGYLKTSHAGEARELLEKAIEAEPDNTQARLLLAGEEIRGDRNDRAIELLEPVVAAGAAELDTLKVYAAALLKKQRYAEAAEVLKKATEKEPNSLPIRENLGLALLKSGQYQPAAEVLYKIIAAHLRENRWERAEKLALELKQANAEDAQVLQKLVDIYTHNGDRTSLITAYRNLADLHERRGLKKNVLGIYEKLQEMEPTEAQWRRKINELSAPESASAKVIESPPEPGLAGTVEDEALEEDLGVLMATGEDLEEEIIVEADQEQPSPAADPIAQAQNDLKRGMFKEAEIRLQRLLMQGSSLPALRMLKELYRLQGRNKAYIDTCQDIIAFIEKSGRKQECIQEYQDILLVDQKNQAAKEALADLVVEFGVENPPAEEPEVTAALEAPTEEEAAGVVEIAEEELVEAQEYDLSTLAGTLEAPAEVVSGPAAPPPVTQPVEAPPPPAVRMVEPPPRSAPVPVAPPPAAAAAGELDELIAEADFYAQQGLHEEAEKLYRTILTRDPGRFDVASKLDEVSTLVTGGAAEERGLQLGDQDLLDFEKSLEAGLRPPKPEVKFSVSREAGEIKPVAKADFQDFISDLKGEIEEPAATSASTSLGDESLQEIFSEFQQGIRQNLSAEDFETHYNLGIAYKEMGLAEEAISEFELAAKSPDFYIDAASMIALIRKDQARWPEAIQAVENALAKIPAGDEARKGLLWELAGIHEEMGEKQRAVDIYLSVYEMDESYRAIGEKLKELGVSPQERKPQAWEEPKDEEPQQEKEREKTSGHSPGKKSSRVSYI